MSLFLNFYFLTPDCFLITASLGLLLFGVLTSTNKLFGFPVLTTAFFYLSIEIFGMCSLLLICQGPINGFFWNGALISNEFTFLAKLFLFFISLVILALSNVYLQRLKISFFEFWVLNLLAVSAASLVLHAFDLLSLYITLEFQSLIFYILASLNRTSEFSTEAGLKYFILGAFSSVFLLIGSALLYNLTGLSNFADFSKLFADSSNLDFNFMLSITLSLVFILIAFLFKFNVAPFHFWSPDVYEGVPVPVTALFATLPKIAILGLIIKIIFFSFFNFLSFIDSFLIFCCICSSVIGVLGAFEQKKWKRFIAYSSIGHASFMLLGLLSNDFFALSSVFIFLIIYIITTLSYFLVLTNLNVFKYPKVTFSRVITDSGNLGVNNKLLTFTVLLTMFSLAGIPPLAGFFSKLAILMGSLKNNLVSISILIILLTCIASFYYLRFLKILYFDTIQSHLVLLPINFMDGFLLTFLSFITIFLFVDFNFINSVAKLMALALLK
uniref:NADH dehydrogenase subunit 2 n=1 Tax=Montagnia macrospora TaxID=2662032 RepID=A0A343UXR7_9FLOR|nr:NADH dehydrogenase subunit 2 [Montagnia macrospora]AVK39474.1 NADH dehydrogenase subunit 2 [Montagnia macrospora]